MVPADASTTVRLDGDEFDIVRMTTTQVVLVSRTTGETVVKTPAEVAVHVPAPSVRRVRAVADVSSSHAAMIDWLAEHLDEVITGRGRDGAVRPEYDTKATTQEVRLQRKLRELRDANVEMSRATLFRKLTAYRRDGRSGLLDGRWLRQYSATAGMSAAVLDAFLDVLNEAIGESTRTRKYVIDEVRRRVRRAMGMDFPLPSEASMYRYLDALAPARYLSGRAATRRSSAARPNKTFTKNVEHVPGAQVQVDSTTLNVLVKTSSGRPERPILTIALDVATRMVVAFTLRLNATKGVDHVYLLAQALTPRQNRPDVSAFRSFLQTHMPEHRLLAADEYLACAAMQPYVRPRRLMTDNGKDYRSTTLRAAAERFGIDVTLSAPHTPTSKQAVERMFGTIDKMFTQNLPGYVGKSVGDRGHRPEDDDLLTIEMVWALLDDWVMETYHGRPHDSLRDPQLPLRRIAPVEAASNATLELSQAALPLSGMSYVSLLDTRWRAISDVGVQYGNRHYDAEALHPLRNTKSQYPGQNHKWPIKVDPYNPDCIWVEVAPDEFIECRERGIADRELQPVFAPLPDDRRTLTARFDATVTGTPMPTPTTPALPAFSTVDLDDEDQFDYDEI